MFRTRPLVVFLVTWSLLLAPYLPVFAGCYHAATRYLPAVNCECSGNSCPAESHPFLSWLSWRDAVPGENGYDTVQVQNQVVGFAHPCSLDINLLVYYGCGVLFSTCMAICPTTSITVVGVAACIGCITATGLTCGADCFLYYCTEDVETNIPISRPVAVGFQGSCVGQGAG